MRDWRTRAKTAAHTRVFLLIALVLTVSPGFQTARELPADSFRVEETTISQIHAALRSKRVTCRGLVEADLARIDAYDKQGPSTTAVARLNPDAMKTADELDAVRNAAAE